ncbi:MAG: hypothetical protein ACI92E_001399, partial [Oceanicoccus sp.]
MDAIELQMKTRALPGKIDAYWYEDDSANLKRTMFHRVTIPLEAFNSGLPDDTQPLSTEMIFDWYNLSLGDISDVDGLNLCHKNYEEAEGDVVIGGVHNWCDVKRLEFVKTASGVFNVSGEIIVEFEGEELGANET